MTVTHDAVKGMIAEMRGTASRTGNKKAEEVMRNGATWLEDVEADRVQLRNEVDKLQQKLADKDEQLAGWKALLDAKTSMCADTNDKPKRKSPAMVYNYAAALTDFMGSNEKARLIPITYVNDAGKSLPQAWYFRKRAQDLGLPVTANKAGEYIVLSRTDQE